MTLQRFLIGFGDSRWPWLGNRRWRPAADRPLPLPSLLLPLLGVLLVAAGLGALFTALLARGPMAGSTWPLLALLRLGLCIGAVATLVLALAWRRRAAQLRAAGLDSPVPAPPLRWWQRILVGPAYALLVFVITPLALALALDNALGTWAWKAARARLVARGEPLTFEDLRPPRPADDANFAMTPLLRPLHDYRLVVTQGLADIAWTDLPGVRRVQAIGLPRDPSPSGRGRSGQVTNDGRVPLALLARSIRLQPVRQAEGPLPTDLAARYGVVFTNVPAPDPARAAELVITNAPADVLDYLRRFDPELNEILQALQRPHSWFPIPWGPETSGMNLTHLGTLKSLSHLFRVRAAARLHSGDADGAFADTRAAFRLAEVLATDPVLISLLVRLAQTSSAVAIAWEGLGAQRWTDPQLAELQSLLARLDFRDAAIAAFRGERILGNAMYENMIAGRLPQVSEASASAPALGPGGPLRALGFAPIGLLRRNQVHQNRLYDILIADLQHPSWPATLTATQDTGALLRRLGLKPLTPDTVLPSALLPAIAHVQAKAAREDVIVRLAQVACALERHRLRNGRHPDRLDDLVPGLLSVLPLDPMNRQPFRYERTEDGGFRLWSVGLNGRDDGGVMPRSTDNDREGDWVWPSPVPSTDRRLF